MRTELIVFVDVVVVDSFGGEEEKDCFIFVRSKNSFLLVFFSQLISQETQSSPLEIQTVSHPALIQRVCGQWVVFDRGSCLTGARCDTDSLVDCV